MTDWNGPVHGQEAPSVCRRLRTVGPVTRRYLNGIALSPKPKKILTTKVTKSTKPCSLDRSKRNSENRIVVAHVHLDPISKTSFSFVSSVLFVVRLL
jgi:hypothetical protein